MRQTKFDAAGAQVDDILYVVPGGFEVHRNAAGQITRSIATISRSDVSVATVTTNFDANTGQPLFMATSNGAVTSNISGLGTVTQLLLKDHLGSMVAEALIVGSVDASGKVVAGSVAISTVYGGAVIHGFGPWGNARNAASPLNGDQRGFTGHEHLAELGLIHMNGRIYDPVIGRFSQADPIIQAPQNAQSHNRYSYVMNNPLSLSDPSGFSWWTKHRRQVIGIVAGILTAGAATWAMGAYALANGATMFAAVGGGLTKVGMIAAAAAGGFASGGINGGNIQSALRGAFMAAVTAGVLQGIGGLGGEVPVATPDIAGGPSIQHLANGTEHVQSGAPGMQMGVGVSDAVLPRDLLDPVVLTGAKDASWFSRSLDWLANGPTDRNTFGGAVWMGMMASSGGRLGAVGRAGTAARGASTVIQPGQAGRFGDLSKLGTKGDKLTPHHMPQAAADFTSRVDGGALVMKEVDHMATRTYGAKGALTARLEADMTFRDVLARDIVDVRTIVGAQYNPGLRQLLEYYRQNFPELMTKP